MAAKKEELQSNENDMAIKPIALLSVYLIIPSVLLFLFVDFLFFDFSISHDLPKDPHEMQWFSLFFMLPHIFASLFTFFDREYVFYYRKRLLASISIMVATIFMVAILNLYIVFMILISVYTVYHLLNQQTGIASMLARSQSALYPWWRWITFAFMAVISLLVIIGEAYFRSIAERFFYIFSLFYFIFSFVVAKKASNKIAFYYVIANAVMIIFTYGLYVAELPFFVILVPRVVHDVTAFYFYISHNKNRNNRLPKNIFSVVFKRAGVSALIYTPLMGMLSTAVVTLFFRQYLFFIIGFLAMFHYYWEGLMWRAGAPHRQSIFIR